MVGLSTLSEKSPMTLLTRHLKHNSSRSDRTLCPRHRILGGRFGRGEMPPPSFLVGSVVLDHGEDSVAGGAPERFGQIAADVVFLDLEHPNEARRGACRRLLHEGPATVEDAVPSLAEERPE